MPVWLVELLILYARVQYYTHRASDYRLRSKTVVCSRMLGPMCMVCICFRMGKDPRIWN